MEFDFERLIVYQKALDFIELVFAFCDKLPMNMQSSLGDQLRRASLSIVNNLAEGSGQQSAKRKKLFYDVSLNSCRECIPVMTIAHRRKLLAPGDFDDLRERCFEISKMLRGLIRAVK
jgi:four helix bundle protein